MFYAIGDIEDRLVTVLDSDKLLKKAIERNDEGSDGLSVDDIDYYAGVDISGEGVILSSFGSVSTVAKDHWIVLPFKYNDNEFKNITLSVADVASCLTSDTVTLVSVTDPENNDEHAVFVTLYAGPWIPRV